MKTFPIPWFNLLLALTVGLWVWSPLTDADVGWHLRYGDYYRQTKRLLPNNTFSWSLPDYEWANHSWGYDVCISWLYSIGGLSALSITGAFVAGLAFYLLLPVFRSPLPVGIAAMLWIMFNQPLLHTGLKSSYLSLLFMAIAWLLLPRSATSKPTLKNTLSFSLLFFLWANLHGQFILGLAFLFIFSIYAYQQGNSRWLPHLLLSLVITLLNPWGIRLWTTVLAHGNAQALAYIFEWMPWSLHDPLMWLYLMYLFFLGWYIKSQKRQIQPPIVASLLLLAFLSLRARRFIPFFTLISLPLFIQALEQLLPQSLLRKDYRFLFVISCLLILSYSAISKKNLLHQTWEEYCHTYLYCSEAAAHFLNQLHPKGRLFNAYSLGGHLIFRAPQIPVFIDGRMTVWQDEKGESPFITYYEVIHNQRNSLAWLMQSHVEYVILQPQFELYTALITAGWKETFTDNNVRLLHNPAFTP